MAGDVNARRYNSCMTSLRIGIDIGGTFTDFVVYDPASGQLQTFKLLSTPRDPAQAVLEGLASIFDQPLTTPDSQLATVIHGSTVATNALLERKGALTALVTTRGFRDVLQIGRQNRPALYDFFADPPPPLWFSGSPPSRPCSGWNTSPKGDLRAAPTSSPQVNRASPSKWTAVPPPPSTRHQNHAHREAALPRHRRAQPPCRTLRRRMG